MNDDNLRATIILSGYYELMVITVIRNNHKN